MKQLRVRHVAQVNPPAPGWEQIPDDEELTFVPLEAVWPRRIDYRRRRLKRDTASGYTRFAEGDVLVPKITPTFEGDRSTVVEGMPTLVATGTTELHIVRPSAQVEGRYLDHLFSSRTFLLGGEAEMIGVAGQKRVPDDWLRNCVVPIESIAEQRAIADYLDAETARIDALVAKKQQLIRLLEERRGLAFSDALAEHGFELPNSLGRDDLEVVRIPTGWRVAKLSSALRQLTNGFVGPTRDILREEGVRYIQGLHIKKGQIDFGRRPFFVEAAWHEGRPRTSLKPDDVLIVQTGDIAQCAVVPPDFGEANCHALLIARTNSAVSTGPFLAAFLQSPYGKSGLLRLATGALHPHLEFGIRDAPIVLPPLQLQGGIVSRIKTGQRRLDKTMTSLTRQIELLTERRQAVITAAVTGEFTVPGAP